MQPGAVPARPPIRRLARALYDLQAGGRDPLLDGPWWFSVTIVVATLGLVVAPTPWKWVALPLVAAFLWVPLCIRWVVALGRSVKAFGEGYRS